MLCLALRPPVFLLRCLNQSATEDADVDASADLPEVAAGIDIDSAVAGGAAVNLSDDENEAGEGGLSSSRLSAAFGAAFGAVDEEPDARASGGVDSVAGIPGVNQGTPLATGGPSFATPAAVGVNAGNFFVAAAL